MTSKSKIVVAAAAWGARIVSPAFRSVTWTTQAARWLHYYDSTGRQTWGAWGGPQDATASRRSTARSHGLYGYVAPLLGAASDRSSYAGQSDKLNQRMAPACRSSVVDRLILSEQSPGTILR